MGPLTRDIAVYLGVIRAHDTVGARPAIWESVEIKWIKSLLC
ncbi:MAG: hypothetical protein JWR80_700 [Bradyrhizobium sp.]|nr:hypothetical protein [Bradyrhizobium sp.]